MRAIKANDQPFEEDVLKSSEPVLVDFYAAWCGPCRVMEPVIRELGDELAGRAKVVQVDVDEEPELASRYEVRSIPNFVVIKDGEVKARLVGAQSKESLLGAITPHFDPDNRA